MTSMEEAWKQSLKETAGKASSNKHFTQETSEMVDHVVEAVDVTDSQSECQERLRKSENLLRTVYWQLQREDGQLTSLLARNDLLCNQITNFLKGEIE